MHPTLMGSALRPRVSASCLSARLTEPLTLSPLAHLPQNRAASQIQRPHHETQSSSQTAHPSVTQGCFTLLPEGGLEPKPVHCPLTCSLPVQPGLSLNAEGVFGSFQEVPGWPHRSSWPSLGCTGWGRSDCGESGLLLVHPGPNPHL